MSKLTTNLMSCYPNCTYIHILFHIDKAKNRIDKKNLDVRVFITYLHRKQTGHVVQFLQVVVDKELKQKTFTILAIVTEGSFFSFIVDSPPVQ